ncbi:hypothetical protein AN958_08215 [Leucoagaricus sp. SymC.cos]|nr:hypothetical protein AN958_08215 [Leucoagaricus sp. SymC.cos]
MVFTLHRDIHVYLAALWGFVSTRRFLARVLSTILCSILVVLKPFSRFGGKTAFLAIAIKELVFSPQENLPQQIEATFLHLVGGLAGVALSSLGKFLASLAHHRIGDSGLTRAIPSLTLTSICFLAGWLKSWLPRLTLASRIACFVSIWLLTFDVGGSQQIHAEAIPFIWSIGVAATTSLISCMIVLRWSSTQFAVELAKAIRELRGHLYNSMETNIAEKSSFENAPSSSYTTSAALLDRSVSLEKLYQQAYFELRIGRVTVKSLKPLITTVEHLRRILSRPLLIPQMSSDDDDEEVNIVAAFRSPALDLGVALLESMRVIEEQILTCYNASSLSPVSESKSDIVEFQTRLVEAVNIARRHLEKISDHLDAQKRKSSGDVRLPHKVFDSCACMIFLLEIPSLVSSLLARMAWSHSSDGLNRRGGNFLDEDVTEESSLLSEREALQGIAERTYDGGDDEDYTRRLTIKRQKTRGRIGSSEWFKSVFFSHWNHPKTLKARLRLSEISRSLERSPHLRHALKNAGGVALLSLPAYLASGTPGRQWFQASYGQWMVISYVWVLETNTGATVRTKYIRVGYLRLSGTLLGALYAWIASLICKSNPYGLVAMMMLAELPIGWVIMNSTFSPMGTVSAVTLPPILFTPYFQPQEQGNTWRIALLRAGLISLGIIAALLANSLLFPRHCRVLFLTRVCQMLGLSNQLFMNMSRTLFQYSHASAIQKKRIYKLEREIQLAVFLNTMDNEASLIPKPMRRYRQVLTALHQLSNILTSLRKVVQHIPKKEIVTTVAPQRRELVSCVCISLFASEQVFRARQPLPQFLPSSRIAFMSLEREVEEQLLQTHQDDNDSRISLIYIFAELDLLAELVDAIDDLVDHTRQLFGTSAWLDQMNPTPMYTSGVTSVVEDCTAIQVV